jgi:putative addiction module killer protein
MGNELPLSLSKALGKGLFELKERNYGYRIYYGFYKKCIIIVVAAGDKTSQDRDIKVARERLSKIKKG